MDQLENALTPNVFYILFALSQENRHGYGIMQEVRMLSDGAVRMGPATLYTTIQRLLELSFIDEVSGPENADSRRRYYRLTADGRSALASELGRMDSAVRKARAMRLRMKESRS